MIRFVKDGGGEISFMCDRTENCVALKRKLTKRNYGDPVKIVLSFNNIELDNNEYIPDGVQCIGYREISHHCGDIILKVAENPLQVPKLIQIDPGKTIDDLVLVMMVVAKISCKLIVFDDTNKQLVGSDVIRDLGLQNDSEIKICSENDLKVTLAMISLSFPDQPSVALTFFINESIDHVKTKICQELNIVTELALFTGNFHLESGRFLIDYLVQNNHQVFFIELDNSDHIQIGEKIHAGRFAKILKGTLRKGTEIEDIVLKEYILDNDKTDLKFLKYDIVTLFKIHSEKKPQFVHYNAMFMNTYFYIGLQYMERGSLSSHLPVRNVDKIFGYSIPILEALDYLHELKIIFRNMKCSNILLDANDNAKLTDFEFSKYLYDKNKCLVGEKGSKSECINWAAPEVLRKEKYGNKADTWSFGATLIEMVTGEPPFNGKSTSRIKNILRHEMCIDYEFPSECHTVVGDVIAMCLKPIPDDRPTAIGLKNVIEGFVQQMQG